MTLSRAGRGASGARSPWRCGSVQAPRSCFQRLHRRLLDVQPRVHTLDVPPRLLIADLGVDDGSHLVAVLLDQFMSDEVYLDLIFSGQPTSSSCEAREDRSSYRRPTSSSKLEMTLRRLFQTDEYFLIACG